MTPEQRVAGRELDALIAENAELRAKLRTIIDALGPLAEPFLRLRGISLPAELRAASPHQGDAK